MRYYYRTLRTALRALSRNKMRSSLTALGIVIGVTAVIAMMELGRGTKNDIRRRIASMGANNIMILPGAATSGGVSWGIGSIQTLTPQDAEAILDSGRCPAVDAVAPLVRVRPQITYGNRNWVPWFIYGTTPAFLTIRDWEDIEEGTSFTDSDVNNATEVCLLGQTVARELFQDESPIGATIRVQNKPLKVIGVLSRKGANTMGADQDDIVIAPWTTVKYKIAGSSATTGNQSATLVVDASQKYNTLSERYPNAAGPEANYPKRSVAQAANYPQLTRFETVDQIYVRAASEEDIKPAMQQIESLLRERHNIRSGEPSDFNLRDMAEIADRQASTTDKIGTLLLFVAMASLLVGGVGIMNIMLVSVTERTREIGLRMAVGARGKDILRQFLTEAVVLCLLGSLVGIALGELISLFLRSRWVGWATELAVPAIIASVAVAATVGIVFGYYPAWKASKLDPIEALRYE